MCSRPGELLPPISLRMRLGLPKPGQIDPHLIRGPRLYPSLLNFYEAPKPYNGICQGVFSRYPSRGGCDNADIAAFFGPQSSDLLFEYKHSKL